MTSGGKIQSVFDLDNRGISQVDGSGNGGSAYKEKSSSNFLPMIDQPP